MYPHVNLKLFFIKIKYITIRNSVTVLLRKRSFCAVLSFQLRILLLIIIILLLIIIIIMYRTTHLMK